MDLSELIKRFIALGYADVGYGPKHPRLSKPALQTEIDEFFQKNPILKTDQGYVDFLETYSAAQICWPDESLIVVIYGFSPDIMLVSQPDEPLIDKNNFFRFAEVIVKTGNTKKDFVGLSYAFDITGNRPYGIYQQTLPYGADFKSVFYEWYCPSFNQWFKNLVETKGRFAYINQS